MTLQVRSVTLNFTLVRAAIGHEFTMIEKKREDKKFCEYFRNHPQSLSGVKVEIKRRWNCKIPWAPHKISWAPYFLVGN